MPSWEVLGGTENGVQLAMRCLEHVVQCALFELHVAILAK
jgi:hypothetical protein